MTTRDAFLADICANPADDTPRLIYADWLDDHGEPERGELIRVQIEIAQAEQAIEKLCKDRFLVLPEDRTGQHIEWIRTELARMRKRERELLSEDGPLQSLFSRYFSTPEGAGFWIDDACFYAAFQRGFVSSLTCTAADWLAHADAITAAQPIERVTLTTWPGRIDGNTLHWDSEITGSDSPCLTVLWDAAEPVSRCLGMRWDGITFTLPSEENHYSSLLANAATFTPGTSSVPK